jgi:peptide/nickel transport system permease protein
MVTYILRRAVTAVLILVGASFLVYLLVAASGDPLAELRSGFSANKEAQIQQRTALLNLGVPAPLRYFGWLKGAAGCLVPFAASCDLGKNLQGGNVTDQLALALGATLSLVSAAFVLAVIGGIALGVVSALRRNSSLDHGATVLAFIFFSLPVFWLAVLLKEFGAIGFNDFLADPVISTPVILGSAAVAAVLAAVIAGGPRRRRAVVAAASFAAVAALLAVLSASNWFLTPALGLPLIAVTGVGVAFAGAYLHPGPPNRRALVAALASTAAGVALFYPLQPWLARATPLLIAVLAISAVVLGAAIGYLCGGRDRKRNVRAAVVAALVLGALTLLDRLMQAWPGYLANPLIEGRPIATFGHATPGFTGDFWSGSLDAITHLALPTVALVLITLATYSRYARGAMSEVMTMDYIRTARAKGLPERTVVLRHAFRNTLIPLTTIVAFDLGGLMGGAVIAERVFAFSGMGTMFVDGLNNVDPNPVMAFFLVVAVATLLCNLLADVAYAALDPRIRVHA